MTLEVRHPEITVTLAGKDSNAFAILGRCRKAMQRAGLPNAEREEFIAQATAGNYDALLQTVIKWFAIA